MLRIKQWLAPPVFPNDDVKTIRASLLNGLLIPTTSLALVLLASDLLDRRMPAALAGINLTVIVVCLLLHFLMRRGQVQLASAGLITLGLIGTTIGVAHLGTIRAPATAIYLALVIMAGLLFDLAGIIVTAILCSLAVLGLTWAENAGQLPPADASVGITQWVTSYTVLFGFVGVLIFTSLRSTHQALQRANKEIAERKRAEDALRQSEERFRAAQDISLEAFTILQSIRNDRGQIIDFEWKYANPMACQILKQPPEKLVGHRLLEVLPGNRTNPALFERYVRIAETGQGDVVELEYCSDGISGWFRNMAIKLGDGIAVSFSDITERKRAEEQLRYWGTHDVLTGTYNRAFFEAELARLEHSRDFPVSVIIADVDNMKMTNDTRGHAAGDELLQRTTRVLQSAFREAEVLARIGGDEFAVLLPHTDAPTAERVVSRVREKLIEHNTEHPDSPVQLSLGLATAERDGVMETFEVADRRMYADKHARKSKQ